MRLGVAAGFFSLISIFKLAPLFASEIEFLINRFEKALNNPENPSLQSPFLGQEATSLESRYKAFLKKYPDARWHVSLAKPLSDGRSTLNVFVVGSRNIGGNNFRLEAKQRLSFINRGDALKVEELIADESILRTSDNEIPISLLIPDSVLTGSKYDIDIVLDKPLGDAMLAGGLITLNSDHVRNQTMPAIELAPMAGGGIFKSVQAPLKPGVQIWAAFLAHPDGLVSIIKRVRVVDDQAKLIP